MIKINLATRKQSVGVVSAGGGSRSISLKKLDFDKFKELPIKKLVIPIVLGFVASYVLDNVKMEDLKKQEKILTDITEKGKKIQTEIEKFKSYEGIKKILDEDELTIRTKLETIQKLGTDRASSTKVLVSISSAIPKEVWLLEFKLDKNELTLRGGSLGFNPVSDFMKGLSESAYLVDVELKGSRQVRESTGNEVTQFDLKAKRR